MEKKVLFVTPSKSILVTAMVKKIEEAGYPVTRCEPDMKVLGEVKEIPAFTIVYLEGIGQEHMEVLSYLSKEAEKSIGTKQLFLIGNPVETHDAFQFVNRNTIAGTFNRPVNVQNLIQQFSTKDKSSLKRILVVDDDTILLRTMKNWLSKQYEVLMANSGMNAISLLATTNVDLILLDYEMPIVSGLEVFNMLKGNDATKNIPVIFLTAKDDKETVMKVLEAKPESYLLKSMKPEDLLKVLNEFFSKRKA